MKVPATSPTKGLDAAAEPPAVVPDHWLFARPDAAIRIVRTGRLSMDVLGPGRARAAYAFEKDRDAVAFLTDTEQQLVAAGFRPRGYGAERRARDRRGHARDGSDRRAR